MGQSEPRGSSGTGAVANRAILRFVILTALALTALFWVLQRPVVISAFVDPYTHFVASVARASLRLIGIDAGGHRSVIASPEFSVNILNVCNGLEVTAILFATILGFPASLRAKLLGLAAGYPLVFLINILRIDVLFVLGFKVPNVFDAVHYYYAQAFVIIATMAIWLIWVSTFSAYAQKTRHQLSD